MSEKLMQQAAPNVQFGKYTIFRKLAVGGMAELYLAKQTGVGGFERTVVLKCILPHLAKEDQFVTMFLDEARVASMLNHPNIVQIYEIGEIEGVYYISMEYIRGPNLKAFRKRLYKRSPRPHYGLISAIAGQAAAGLHYAHHASDEMGTPLDIVHRDVSPTNLLLSYNGAVKLVDFGVAKASIQEHKTRAGMVKGKYRYMSPEQVLAQPLDMRSDIYALGAILYELATNVVVFGRRTEAETIRAVYMDPIMPPSHLIEDFPEELNKIIMKCLARERDDRFHSCNEVRLALDSFVRSRSHSFGPQEISDLLRGLFAEEQEHERTGLSGAALSKSDYIRFASEPGVSVLGEGVGRDAPSSGSLPQMFPIEEQTDPSADPSSGGSLTPSLQFGDPEQFRGATAISASFPAPSLGAGIAMPSSPPPSLEKSTDPDFGFTRDPGIDDLDATFDHRPQKKRGVLPWALGVLAVLVVAGGLLLGLDLLGGSDPPPPTRTPTHSPGFASLYNQAQGHLQKGQMMQAVASIARLKKQAHSETQKQQVSELQAHLRCLPRLSIARDFARSGDRRSAVKILESLQKRCPKVQEVQTLLAQNRAAVGTSPPALPSPRSARSPVPRSKRKSPRIRRRRRRVWRRPRRARPVRRPQKRAPLGRTEPITPRPPVVRPPATGLLYINTRPSAQVELDGQMLGFTPLNGVKARAGTHKMRVTLTGYRPVERTIRVRSGKSTILSLRMRRIARAIPRPPPPRRGNKAAPKLPFSSVRLPKRLKLRIYLSDTRGMIGRIYTDKHPRLCRRIEREVQRLMGIAFSVRGITGPWRRYVKRRDAKSGRDRVVFYPRAVAYVIYSQLKRGRSKGRVAQILVGFERRRRWRRYLNR